MEAVEVETIAVVGAGFIGTGIAQEMARGGYPVRLNDISEQALERSLTQMRKDLQSLARAGVLTSEQCESTLGRIRASTKLEESVRETDLVIESIDEDLDAKKTLFGQLDVLCGASTIFASNSSTLMPSRLAPSTQRPHKVLVAHFFYPPSLLPVVEIVRGPQTDDESVDAVRSVMVRAGKTPVVVEKEAPGFIGNRLQAALVREALSIVGKGIASARDVDLVVKGGFGRRLAAAGVFEVFEPPGWDLVHAAWPHLFTDLECSTQMPPLLRDKVERGETGVAAGKGFYDWTPESAEAFSRRLAQMLITIAETSDAAPA